MRAKIRYKCLIRTCEPREPESANKVFADNRIVDIMPSIYFRRIGCRLSEPIKKK